MNGLDCVMVGFVVENSSKLALAELRSIGEPTPERESLLVSLFVI